jgi:hypothetical protein
MFGFGRIFLPRRHKAVNPAITFIMEVFATLRLYFSLYFHEHYKLLQFIKKSTPNFRPSINVAYHDLFTALGIFYKPFHTA